MQEDQPNGSSEQAAREDLPGTSRQRIKYNEHRMWVPTYWNKEIVLRKFINNTQAKHRAALQQCIAEDNCYLSTRQEVIMSGMETHTAAIIFKLPLGTRINCSAEVAHAGTSNTLFLCPSQEEGVHHTLRAKLSLPRFKPESIQLSTAIIRASLGAPTRPKGCVFFQSVDDPAEFIIDFTFRNNEDKQKTLTHLQTQGLAIGTAPVYRGTRDISYAIRAGARISLAEPLNNPNNPHPLPPPTTNAAGEAGPSSQNLPGARAASLGPLGP
jgi:hypothetical protein